MTSNEGDKEDRLRRRRGYSFALQAVLLLPAQGIWLALALSNGSFWWAAWAVALAVLMGAYLLLIVQDRRRGPQMTPLLLTMPLLIVIIVIALGVVLWLLT